MSSYRFLKTDTRVLWHTYGFNRQTLEVCDIILIFKDRPQKSVTLLTAFNRQTLEACDFILVFKDRHQKPVAWVLVLTGRHKMYVTCVYETLKIEQLLSRTHFYRLRGSKLGRAYYHVKVIKAKRDTLRFVKNKVHSQFKHREKKCIIASSTT